MEPKRVRDLLGQEVTDLVGLEDARLWQTDLSQYARSSAPELREGLVAEFKSVPTGATPVLEIVGGNTALLELAMGRFFALMGNRLDEYIRQGNDPDSPARILP